MMMFEKSVAINFLKVIVVFELSTPLVLEVIQNRQRCSENASLSY